MDIWYASYGSNLMEERFLAYIYGGIVPGSERPEQGCRDQTAPKASDRIDIPYPLYFSKERSKWGIGGVAFIGTKRLKESKTIGRMYLISEEQFFDVVMQENNGESVEIDLEEVKQKGFTDIHQGWYNRIVFLGQRADAPIFTFTSSCQMDKATLIKPTKAYLKTIANGLMELGLSLEDIVEYFLSQRGIEGNFSICGLRNYLMG